MGFRVVFLVECIASLMSKPSDPGAGWIRRPFNEDCMQQMYCYGHILSLLSTHIMREGAWYILSCS